jgi:hypothetical protein
MCARLIAVLLGTQEEDMKMNGEQSEMPNGTDSLVRRKQIHRAIPYHDQGILLAGNAAG